MHSFVPIAGTQHMVGGVGLSVTMYLQCTAVIVNGLYIKFKCHGKILVQFFFTGKNHIRPLSDQCTIRDFEIEMSLSMVYI